MLGARLVSSWFDFKLFTRLAELVGRLNIIKRGGRRVDELVILVEKWRLFGLIYITKLTCVAL